MGNHGPALFRLQIAVIWAADRFLRQPAQPLRGIAFSRKFRASFAQVIPVPG